MLSKHRLQANIFHLLQVQPHGLSRRPRVPPHLIDQSQDPQWDHLEDIHREEHQENVERVIIVDNQVTTHQSAHTQREKWVIPQFAGIVERKAISLWNVQARPSQK